MSEYPPSAKILVSSDGTKIYADASGHPDKPSIVFIHGLGLSAAVFDKIFSTKRYTEEFYLVRYDMRGHGRSDKPDTEDSYTSKLFADDFAVVLKAFNLHKPVVVGWSLGATVCADIAVYLPDTTLLGIVYLAGLPYVGPILEKVATPSVLAMIPGLFSEDSVVTTLSTTREFIDSLFLDVTKIRWKFRCLWLGMTAMQRPLHRQLSLSRQQDPARLFELGAQGLPLLVLGGTHDKLIMSKVVAEEMRPHFNDIEVRFIEKGGSHAVFHENPEETMDKILDFAQRVIAEVKCE